jgi:hypothetical protein
LADELTIPYPDTIERLDVDINLDLAALSEEQAADALGEELARQIRVRLAARP